jgi:putative hydrolase of the HAD superfamily
MIEAVTFDFWNTIVRVPSPVMREARRRAVVAACERCGVEVEAELLAAGLEEAALSWDQSWKSGQHLHPQEVAARFVRALEIKGPMGEIVVNAFLGAGLEVDLKLAPGIGTALEALGERGIRAGIVCDVGFSGGMLLRELLAREGLLDHFHGWGFSDEVGCYKPAPQIFEAALGGLGAEPEAVMHIGDLRRTDVIGAARLGMKTARYRGLSDDMDKSSGIEADFVLDSHLELLDLLERC